MTGQNSAGRDLKGRDRTVRDEMESEKTAKAGKYGTERDGTGQKGTDGIRDGTVRKEARLGKTKRGEGGSVRF